MAEIDSSRAELSSIGSQKLSELLSNREIIFD